MVDEKTVLKEIVENTGVLLAYFDPNFNFIAANQIYAKVCGRTVEELMGKNYFVLFPNAKNQAIFEKVRDTGESVTFFDKPFKLVDAHEQPTTYCDWTLTPVKGNTGQVQGLILSLFETKRNKAETRLKRHNKIQRSINRILAEALTAKSEEDLGEICLAVATEITESEFGFIGEINEDGLADISISKRGRAACVMYDQSGHQSPPRSFEIHGIYGRVLLDGKSLFTNDPLSHPDSIGIPPGHPPLKSFLGVPLKNDGKTIGIIAVANSEHAYSEYEVDALETLAPAIVEAFMRKRAEQKIVNLSKFPSENPNPVFRLDKYGTILYSNPACSFLLSEWKVNIGEKVPHEILTKIVEAFSAEKNIDFEHRCDNRTFVFYVVPVIKKNYVNIYGIDITDRKEMDAVLQSQSLVIRSAQDAIFTTDESGIIMSWNPSAEDLFGWNAEDVIGKSAFLVFDSVYSSSGETIEQIIEEIWVKGFWRGETTYRKNDGSSIIVSVSFSAMKDENGTLTGVAAIVHDITPRKEREKKLRDAQHDLNHAQRVGKIGSWRLDTQRNVLRWSLESYRLFGVPEGVPLTYETFLEIIHPDDREYVDDRWKAALRGEPYDIEHRIVVDGKIKWVREKTELEFDDEGNVKGGFGTNQDITDFVAMREKLRYYSKHLEDLVIEKTKQLKDTERLAGIGQTAGMIGHDIRNPLQTIDGAIYLAKDCIASLSNNCEYKNELEEIFDLIKDQVGYIDHMVADLQDFARREEPQNMDTSLQKLIIESLSVVNCPENIKVNNILGEDVNLYVDPAKMKRVFINIIRNSFQAMPHGGHLTITLVNVGDGLSIGFEDTGVGIPEDIRKKIFTPLFTTKSKGQGFGLAVCKKIVEAHGGEIMFQSIEGQGTTFIINLPLIKETD